MELLAREIQRDPVPAQGREASHVHLVAMPYPDRPEMLGSVVNGAGWQQRIVELSHRSWTRMVQQDKRLQWLWHNSAFGVTGQHRRSGGVAPSSHYVSQDRVVRHRDNGDPPREESLFDLELSEDGLIRVLLWRAVAPLAQRMAAKRSTVSALHS